MRKHFERALTATAVLEPLRSCSPDADAVAMAGILHARDFDVAGVQQDETTPAHGYVTRDSLSGAGYVRDYVQDLSTSVLLADSTPLAEVLHVMARRQFMFVMIGSEVRGIITQADLNKPAVRVYLFGVLSLFEMHVTFWIRAEHPSDTWESLVASRLGAAKRLRARKHKRGHDTSLLDCASLGVKKEIVVKSPAVQRRLGIATGDLEQFTKVDEVRNSLAHSYEDLAREHSWKEIADLVQFVETLVTCSDQAIEAEASTRADGFRDDLWAAA
jgi:hypothetical protein